MSLTYGCYPALSQKGCWEPGGGGASLHNSGLSCQQGVAAASGTWGPDKKALPGSSSSSSSSRLNPPVLVCPLTMNSLICRQGGAALHCQVTTADGCVRTGAGGRSLTALSVRGPP
jgi:hypothetical protein